MVTVPQKRTVASRLLYILLFTLLSSRALAVPASNTTRIKEGAVRYHYESEAKHFCSSVVIIGVGTTMKVDGYDLLAVEMVRGRPGLVAAIVDHSPGNPLKLSTKRYVNLVNTIAARTEDIIHVCRRRKDEEILESQQPTSTKFFLGGHSASGMVAIESLSLVEGFSPAGIIGLSPFKITADMMPISVPALYWGFSTTTCGVAVGAAADQAYELSAHHSRVLYQLQNPSAQPTHCIFANHGCIPVCPCSDSVEYAWIRPAVGESIHQFLLAVESNNFTRSSLDLNLPQETKRTYLRMFVNQDQGPKAESFSEVKVG